MSDGAGQNSSQQVYNVHSGDALLSQVARVICVLLPRALMVAGFSERGDLLMIRFSDYKKNLPTWILDFFEHQFITEPLLGMPQKVSAVFVATDKTFLVPEVLYSEGVADKWMKKIYFVEGNEVISLYHVREDKTNYMYAWPAAIKSLTTRYFAQAKVMPFAAYQFYKPYKSDCSMQCCITADMVYATLYNNRLLTWHQAFSYQNAEDIAYHIKLLCQQNNIDAGKLSLQCTVTNKALAHVVTDLTQYFPDLKDGSGNVGTNDKSWTGTIHLLQQLYACVL